MSHYHVTVLVFSNIAIIAVTLKQPLDWDYILVVTLNQPLYWDYKSQYNGWIMERSQTFKLCACNLNCVLYELCFMRD